MSVSLHCGQFTIINNFANYLEKLFGGHYS